MMQMPCEEYSTCPAYLQLGCHWCSKDDYCMAEEFARIEKILDRDLEFKAFRNGERVDDI